MTSNRSGLESDRQRASARLVANFNDFEDVRAWISLHGIETLRVAYGRGDFSGKTREVAKAYLAHIDEHGYDLVEDDDDDDDAPWIWKPWRIAVVALFIAGPPLLVWAINAWRG